MNIHVGTRLSVVAAAMGVAALFGVGLVVALGVRSVVAGPDADPAGPVPNPGHPWTEVQGHGDDVQGLYISTQDDEALELRVNGSRALRLEPNATSPNVIGGYSGNSVTAGVVGGAICGGGTSDNTNRVTDNYGTVGGGEGNQAGFYADEDPNTAPYATVGGGTGNWALRPFATIAGGAGNTAGDYSAIGGGYQNIAWTDYGTIGAGYHNWVTGDYGTVAGGENNQAGGDFPGTNWPYATVGGGQGNTASGGHATVGGGSGSTASGEYATVGGGTSNDANYVAATVAGGYDNTASGSLYGFSTVGGGESNTASGDFSAVGGGQTNTASSIFSTLGGGYDNTASGVFGTVGGGQTNTASGNSATVPGGAYNTAAGAYSFAAGNQAKANNLGCFVWGDSTATDLTCGNDNRFITRASGGVYFYTSGDLSTGAYLAAGSGTWTDLSDRNLKDNFTPVDGQAVLASVAEMPIATWNYKAQDAAIRHMGPVAQDFYAAFGLGESETGISTVDADGVALAAIQGLYQLSQEQAARIRALEEENASLQQRLGDLEERVTALEGGAPANEGSVGPLSGLSTGWLALGGLLVVGLALVQRRRAGGRP